MDLPVNSYFIGHFNEKFPNAFSPRIKWDMNYLFFYCSPVPLTAYRMHNLFQMLDDTGTYFQFSSESPMGASLLKNIYKQGEKNEIKY